MAFHPYLFFSGTCREAMTRYHEIFGGQLDVMAFSDAPEGVPTPPGDDDLVMHAALTIGGQMLMASDDPTGDGGPAKGLAITFTTPDAAEAERVFAGLAEGGQTTMPLGETFWSPKFGMCTDRFGISWMVSVDAPTS